jgi:hypothetical protein
MWHFRPHGKDAAAIGVGAGIHAEAQDNPIGL